MQLAETKRETRVPVRLRTTALSAARDGHVGLATVAALLDRNDDVGLYEEVMGNSSAADISSAIASANPATSSRVVSQEHIQRTSPVT